MPLSDPERSGLEPTVGPQDALAPDPLEPAPGGLLEAALDARYGPGRAARVLGLIRLGQAGGARAITTLAAAADDPDWVIRKYALGALGQLGLPGGLAIALTRLSDPEREVRRAAHRTLKRLDDRRQLPAWLAALGDPDWTIRAVALEALAGYTQADLRDRFLAALNDEAWLNRFLALRALERYDDAEVRSRLLARLDSDPTLAPYLALALAERGPGALDGLLERLDTAHPGRALAIASALGQLDDPRAREALAGLIGHPDPELDAAILQQGAAMRPLLRARLGAEDWITRWHACQLLGESGGPDGAVPLLPLVDDPRPEVRLAALGALGKLGDERALIDLRRCLGDASWHIRLAAVEAIAAIPSEEARHALVDALADARAEVRHAARRALRALGEAAHDALVEGLLRRPALHDELAWLLRALEQ